MQYFGFVQFDFSISCFMASISEGIVRDALLTLIIVISYIFLCFL